MDHHRGIGITAVAAVMALACTPATVEPAEGATAPEPARLVLPVAHASSPLLPGPAPRQRSFDAVALNARCEACHQAIATEWRGSLHQLAHLEPTFRLQLSHEPLPLCTGCHAPEVARADVVWPPADVAELGVGCVSCHVVGDTVLAAPADRPVPQQHTLTHSASFGGVAACAGCHEFAFPGERGASPLLMQSTVREHAASTHAGESCASCHMPLVADERGAHRSHAFGGTRDPERRRAAISTTARREGDELVIALAAVDVGHAFPTGDMLRRLELEVMVFADDRLLRRERRWLRRHFGIEKKPNSVPRRRQIDDDRLPADGTPREHRVTLPATATRARYTLTYQRVADPHGDEGRGSVAAVVVLADRELSLRD